MNWRILLWITLFLAFLPQALAQPQPSTFYNIELDPNGSATWVLEYRFHLATQAEENFFKQYMAQFEAQKQAYLENFSKRMQELVERASLLTGRTMEAKNFQVMVGLLGGPIERFGVIKYQFDWEGFASLERDKVVVGDVFEGGLFLSREDALIIKHPPRFEVIEVSPQPDEFRSEEFELIWYGLRDFGSGEPRVVLEPKPMAIPFLWLLLGVGAAAALGGALVWRRKRQAKHPPWEELTKSDEDRVLDLLKQSGGALYQSDLVRLTGFSKSKVSALLALLKQRGVIEKTKRGRKKLITLRPEA